MLRAVFIIVRFWRVIRLAWRLTLDRRVPLIPKMLVPAALAYFLYPTDIVNDFIPFVGRFDDLLVLSVAVALFLALAPRELVTEHLSGSGPPRPSGPRHEGRVIDGKYRITDED